MCCNITLLKENKNNSIYSCFQYSLIYYFINNILFSLNRFPQNNIPFQLLDKLYLYISNQINIYYDSGFNNI